MGRPAASLSTVVADLSERGTPSCRPFFCVMQAVEEPRAKSVVHTPGRLDSFSLHPSPPPTNHESSLSAQNALVGLSSLCSTCKYVRQMQMPEETTTQRARGPSISGAGSWWYVELSLTLASICVCARGKVIFWAPWNVGIVCTVCIYYYTSHCARAPSPLEENSRSVLDFSVVWVKLFLAFCCPR